MRRLEPPAAVSLSHELKKLEGLTQIRVMYRKEKCPKLYKNVTLSLIFSWEINITQAYICVGLRIPRANDQTCNHTDPHWAMTNIRVSMKISDDSGMFVS